MKETNLTREHSADVVRGLVAPSAARSFSWIEDMANETGADILEGSVVVVLADGTIELADTVNDPRPTGVVLDTIDDGETGQVCFGGPVDLVLVTASVTAGQYGQTSTTPGQAQVTTGPASAFCVFTDSGTEPSAFLWGGRGGGGVVAGLLIEDLETAETDTTLVLSPDGTGGVEWDTVTGAVPWFNVKDYGATGDGTTDDTTAVSDAITALVAAGCGVLYFPCGNYITSGGFVLSVPMTVLGDGAWNTTVTCNSGTAVLFEATYAGIAFENIVLYNNQTTPSAGAGIRTTGAAGGINGRYDNVFVNGFYDNFDFQDGYAFALTRSVAYNPVRYSVRVRDTVAVDAGDSVISDCVISAGRNATAGIRIETSGGLKIIGNKINGTGSVRFTNGIDLAPSSTTTILLIEGNSIENVSGDGIHVATSGSSWDGIAIVGNQFGLYTNSTGNAVDVTCANLGEVNDLIVVANIFKQTGGGSAAAITLTKVNNARIGSNVRDGFGSMLAQSGSTNIVEDAAASSFATPAIVLGTAAAAGAASTVIRSDSTIVAFDATVPTTQAFSDSAATGSAAVAARRDHLHGMPAAPSAGIGEILISDTPSTPLVFADLIQNEAQDDLVYADP